MNILRSVRLLAAPVILGGAAVGINAACPSWPTGERFEVSTDATEVRDLRTGLIWARCAVGQVWSGSLCTGTPIRFSHEDALAHAATQTGWRLPNRRELFSLADKGCAYPAIDQVAFPGAPPDLYWSSSPSAGTPDAWFVGYHTGGGLGYSYRSNPLILRLVRF